MALASPSNRPSRSATPRVLADLARYDTQTIIGFAKRDDPLPHTRKATYEMVMLGLTMGYIGPEQGLDLLG